VITNVLEYVRERILVADGAMGTELYERGIPRGHCYDELNLSMPHIVERVHSDYIAAGARMIETNTFGASKHILGTYYDLADKAFAINEKGARIARAAAIGREVLVAGSVGPVTRPFETELQPNKGELEGIFTEQITALVQGGVDLIVLETFADVEELLIAFDASQRIEPSMPVICSMSFVEGGRTIAGEEPQIIAGRLYSEGARLLGANCGTGPRGIFDAVKSLAIYQDIVLSAMPNAGLPTFTGGHFEYSAEPEYFAHYARKFAGAGVSIIGGCCGTRPEHIKTMAEAVANITPKSPKVVVVGERAEDVEKPLAKEPTSFERKVFEKFVYTVEIDPPRGVDVQKVIEAVRDFKEAGGDAVNVADIPMARLRMGALPLAAAIRQQIDINVVLHVTARDRNLIAIQSDLLGAHALGIDNVLALKGDPPSIGDYPFATGVYDVTSPGIVAILASFARGKDRLGVKIDKPANFFVGVAVNQNARHWEREVAHLNDKIAAGAGFIQTQPVFDMEKLDMILDAVNGRVPIIVSLLILASQRHAEFLHNEVPGVIIPAGLREKMADLSGDDGRARGLEIAANLLEDIRKRTNGVCLMPPFGRYELALELMP